MTAPLSNQRVRTFLRDLAAVTADRAKAETEAARAAAARAAAADVAVAKERQRVEARTRAERTAVEEEYQQQAGAVAATAEAETKAAEAEFQAARTAAVETFEQAEEAVTKEYQETCWTQEAVFDANKKAAQERREAARRQFAETAAAVQALREEVAGRLTHWALIPKAVEGAAAPAPPNDTAATVAAIRARVASARTQADRLRRLVVPGLLIGDRYLWGCFAVWVLIALSGLALAPVGPLPGWAVGPILATVAVGAGGPLLRLWLAAHARNKVTRICQPLHQALAEAEALRKQGEEREEAEYRRVVTEEKKQLAVHLRAAEQGQRQQKAEITKVRDRDVQAAEARRRQRTEAATTRRAVETRAVEDDYRRKSTSLEGRHSRDVAAAEAQFTQAQEEAETAQAAEFAKLSEAWHAAVARLRAEWEAIAAANEARFPDWSGPGWGHWSPPADVPAGIRFGELDVDLGRWPDGAPRDPRLEPFTPARFGLPALLSFPHRCATLLEVGEAGRAEAVQALQAMMLRFLTALPPGKVRFTIIDPVGLGENFAGFMHLADHDEQLVASRIWTETIHIDKRLADMTAHVENVIQKYLRNQFTSIEEYNEQAGEVAEPYRVLVVANFPVNFSLDAARRLASLAEKGAVCGVYTLVSVDVRQPLPQGFPLSDLRLPSQNLVWKDDRFAWKDTDFGPYPLATDAPPDTQTLTRIVNEVGTKAKNANRVEVDFDFITPPAERVWAGDSRGGIDVPLGRAGATKRQHLQLGKGTAQHVLVAGKTGSGKSTLLHALITNLALYYGPDEVELYLIDFKKGVEFKTYATHGLPHARVIAVESEREFGLSVLQRLDAELKRRGDLFRAAGVQDLAGFRKSPPVATGGLSTLPRILLIVDEFQEFFVEDDKIAQEAALLLDRLVRQGRAFGLHVLLGSQTLGGAYSLARSTIDQMAVRIALQCSEADANLILSKDNGAARLLSRPGEAIYNDANGLVEGNDVFQVVWLPEARREDYLTRVQTLARERGFRPPGPTIVFEGNVPAEITHNHLLNRWLGCAAGPAPREPTAWLGDALAIKDPTAATFRRQSGANLLLVGQQAEAARSILAGALIALAAQQPPADDGERAGPPAFTLLDGTPGDDPQAGYLTKVAAALPTGTVRQAGARDLATALGELSDELARRQREPDLPAPPLFLVVHGLQRFRDLRKSDDDFGFGRRGGEQTASPSQQFTALLREGPAAGIHVLAWVDTLVNLTRALDRQGLREFEMRVLFQMSVADSSTLIDTPAASRLGLHRALFASEEMGQPEKFRPYSLPDDDWLTSVRERLARPRTATPVGAA